MTVHPGTLLPASRFEDRFALLQELAYRSVSLAQIYHQADVVNKTLSANQIIRPSEELVSLYGSCAKLK